MTGDALDVLGCGQDLMREYTQRVCGVAPEQVVGTAAVIAWARKSGRPTGSWAGSPSVGFDTVESIVMPPQAQKLAKNGASCNGALDAHGHSRTIMHCAGTKVIPSARRHCGAG